MHDFTGRVALVTGAASGIGQEVARQFLEAGARVGLVDIAHDRLDAAAVQLDPDGGRTLAHRADVAVGAAAAAAVVACERRFGRVDFLVNAAGLAGLASPLAEMPEEEWARVLAINLTAGFVMMKQAIPAMLRAGGGAIVNISSVAGLVAAPNQAPYIASKFGIIGATKAAAADYAGRGIRANVVCPGGVRTPMLQAWLDADPDREKFAAAGHPLGRIAEPGEIAAPILFLCSPGASFITGAVITVDGGFTLS